VKRKRHTRYLPGQTTFWHDPHPVNIGWLEAEMVRSRLPGHAPRKIIDNSEFLGDDDDDWEEAAERVKAFLDELNSQRRPVVPHHPNPSPVPPPRVLTDYQEARAPAQGRFGRPVEITRVKKTGGKHESD